MDGDQLQTAIAEVAGYRRAELSPLREVLEDYPAIAGQVGSVAAQAEARPQARDFGDLLEDFYTFADPVIAGDVTGLSWTPSGRAWR